MGRSIAEQTDAELGGRTSVLVRQRRDHVELDRLLARLRATTGAEQDEVLTDVHRLVFTHAFAEESVLFPAVRRLPGGSAVTLDVEHEHQQINELVRLLDRTPTDDPRRPELVERYAALLDRDVREEEDELLPLLQEALDVRAQRRLGLVWEAVRRTAPTRPHPVVARRPPGNVLSALPLSLLDRTRDRLDRSARRAATGGRRRRAASRALGRVSDVVEQLPPLRRGEDPSTSVPGRAA